VLAGLAVIVFLIGYGLDRRRQQQAVADAASELDRVDSRMTGFLEALDRRSSLLEEDAVDRTRRILTAEIQADQSRQQAQRPAAAMAAPSLPNPAPKSV
jgi:hypothetical protein